MAQKIIYWCLFALVLSLGFGQLLRFEVFVFPLYLHDLLVTILLLLCFKPKYLATPPLWLKIFGLGLLLSSLSALLLYPLSTLLIPSLYTLRLLAYLVLYFLLSKRQVVVPDAVFIISALTALCIGLWQYLTLPDLRMLKYLGWDDHLSRLTFPHFDPTFSAVMLGLALLSVTRLKHWYLSLALLLGILLTYSRSTWVALLATLYLPLKNFYLIIIFTAIFALATLSLPQKFGEGTNLWRTFSIYSRLESDLSYLREYPYGWVLGRGLNTYALESDDSLYPNHATGPNNSYLYLLMTTGILGFVGWMGFVVYLYRHTKLRLMFTFFLLASLFNNVMFYPFTLLWVLLILAKVPTST